MRHVAAVLFLALTLGACDQAKLYELAVGPVTLNVEVVDTEEGRARGLMFRESVPERGGMLFVFDEAAPRAFYMKNTRVPLSIAYIDERLVIREIYDMEPFSLETIPSDNPVMYALEVNQGSFAEWGVAPGDRLVLSDRLRKRIGR